MTPTRSSRAAEITFYLNYTSITHDVTEQSENGEFLKYPVKLYGLPPLCG